MPTVRELQYQDPNRRYSSQKNAKARVVRNSQHPELLLLVNLLNLIYYSDSQTHLIIRSLLCRTHTDECRGLCGDIFSPSCATLRNYCVYYHALVMSGRGDVSKGKVLGLERKQRLVNHVLLVLNLRTYCAREC